MCCTHKNAKQLAHLMSHSVAFIVSAGTYDIFYYSSDLFHTSMSFTFEMESNQLLIYKNLKLFNA